jgi:hypothetical protein
MKGDKIKELIQASELPNILKLKSCGFIDYASEQREKELQDIKLITDVSGVKSVSEIVLSFEDVKIYTVNGKDKWDIKYPYRIIYKQNDVWLSCNIVSPNLDTAMLYYLEHKYLGLNGHFVGFATRMLEMPDTD